MGGAQTSTNRNELTSNTSTTMHMGEAAAFPTKEPPARLHMAATAPPVASRLSLDSSLLPTGGAWTDHFCLQAEPGLALNTTPANCLTHGL